ncbi:transposase [Herbidospora sp. RD11066]
MKTSSSRQAAKILYIDRTGIPWRYLPRDYPPWGTVYLVRVQDGAQVVAGRAADAQCGGLPLLAPVGQDGSDEMPPGVRQIAGILSVFAHAQGVSQR